MNKWRLYCWNVDPSDDAQQNRADRSGKRVLCFALPSRSRSLPEVVVRWFPLLLIAALTARVAMAWQPDGMKVTGALGEQLGPLLVARDGQGGAFVTWVDYRDEVTSSADLYLQHITPTRPIPPRWPP